MSGRLLIFSDIHCSFKSLGHHKINQLNAAAVLFQKTSATTSSASRRPALVLNSSGTHSEAMGQNILFSTISPFNVALATMKNRERDTAAFSTKRSQRSYGDDSSEGTGRWQIPSLLGLKANFSTVANRHPVRGIGNKTAGARASWPSVKGGNLRGPVRERHEIEVHLFRRVTGNRVPQRNE